jgi:thimet oligopeptidase
MEHKEVETFFHEFGHLIHHVFGGQQKWARFSGVTTEWDFVEAPSQIFEEWSKDYETLKAFATNEKGEVIPKALVDKLRASDDFGKALWVRHQMFYAALSLNMHNHDPATIDQDKMVEEIQNKYSAWRFVPGTHMQASFGHLNGYSAMYYTYMWSMVIAKDMFSAFQKAGVLDPATALRYRKTILEPGGSKDAADLVKDFLGRPYGFKSYEDWLNQKKAGKK